MADTPVFLGSDSGDHLLTIVMKQCFLFDKISLLMPSPISGPILSFSTDAFADHHVDGTDDKAINTWLSYSIMKQRPFRNSIDICVLTLYH